MQLFFAVGRMAVPIVIGWLLSYYAAVKLLALISTLLWLLGSAISAVQAHGNVFSMDCHEEMNVPKDTGQMHGDHDDPSAGDHSHHEQSRSDDLTHEDCDEKCCDGVCLCTFQISSVMLLHHEGKLNHALTLRVNNGKFHLLPVRDPPFTRIDPPPRPVV